MSSCGRCFRFVFVKPREKKKLQNLNVAMFHSKKRVKSWRKVKNESPAVKGVQPLYNIFEEVYNHLRSLFQDNLKEDTF